MSVFWEKEALYAKSRQFFEYAFEHDREDPRFGLWSAMGLELLARAAIASVSPTLLAESDKEHKYLLHALRVGSEKVPRRSIATNQVLALCKLLFKEFTEAEYGEAVALTNRRNDEVHTGVSAFKEYTTQQWIAGFYSCCKVLAEQVGETLESLFGAAEAVVALQIIDKAERDTESAVKSLIAAHKKVFDGMDAKEQTELIGTATDLTSRLAFDNHHRVICPACGAPAAVQGVVFGREQVTHKDDVIIVKQAVSPNAFACTVCKLKLQGYSALRVASLGDQYTRTTTYQPAAYYGMIDPGDDEAISQLLDGYMTEYDNE